MASNINVKELVTEIINTASSDQKCTLVTCNKTHCRTPWHKPCAFAKYGLAEKIRPLLVVVSGMEILFGVILISLMLVYGYDYDTLYGTEDLRVISVACLNGSITLFITGCMLLVAIIWKIRRLMLVYVFVSTILGVYIFILSVFKIHYGIVIINKESPDVGCRENQNFFSSAACLMGLLTLLGSVIPEASAMRCLPTSRETALTRKFFNIATEKRKNISRFKLFTLSATW